MELVLKNSDSIEKLCKSYKVARLYVFGSILTDRFRPDSDVDFLIDFKQINRKNYADNYFDLKDALGKLLNREVDLLEERAVKNPFLKEEIDSNKRIIYGEKN